MMEQRLSVVGLGVADLGRATRFYEEVVGWKATPSPPGIAFVDFDGLVFSLFPHSELAKQTNSQVGDTDGSAYQGFTLTHNVRSKEEADQIFARLREKGATIIKEPEEVFWGGYSGYFSDLDGHLWEIAHNPYWVIQEDGRVSMGEG